MYCSAVFETHDAAAAAAASECGMSMRHHFQANVVSPLLFLLELKCQFIVHMG